MEGRIYVPSETDGAACEGRCGGERGEDELCCFYGGDVTDEVEVEGCRMNVREDVCRSKGPFVQDGLAALGV